MTLITATHTVLHRCCQCDSRLTLSQIFKVQYLGPLSQSEALDFLSARCRDMRQALVPHAEKILYLGGRFPILGLVATYYLQAFDPVRLTK
jgi:hypothetical protein